MDRIVFVTVRFGSSRLPGKCFLKINGKPVLEHLLERLINADLFPVVCTSTDKQDDIIYSLASELNVDIFRGSLLNKLDRWAGAAKSIKADYVHIIDADDPLIDIEEIQESLAEAKNCGLDLLRTSDRSDSGYASVGMTAKTKFLDTLAERARHLASDDFDVIPWESLLLSNDKVQKKQDLVLIPSSTLNLRLTLDYPEDFELISSVISELGNTTSRFEIEKFLEMNPKLATINSEKTVHFLENKRRQLKDNFNLG